MTNPTPLEDAGEHIGKVFGGKYRIIDALGKGGMGRIYTAEQISLRRTVAIKMVTASDNVEANKRFLLEASLTANLDHPNIVNVHDFGRTEDGTLFLVMERLQGVNLKQWVESKGALDVEAALRVTKQLCGALTQAHQKNVVHRDIKPSNIMLTNPAGAGLTAKLIDFGLVKSVNDEGMNSSKRPIQGTPMFMAPEQINNGPVDDRVDVYALGLTLLYALTGQLPYPRATLSTLLQSQLSQSPQGLVTLESTLPAEHLLSWILKTAVHKNATERFQNALQMLRSVELCEQSLHSGSFPTLHLESGVLTSPSGDISLEAVESSPIVVSGSYVAGGTAMSEAYARTLTMSGIYDTSDDLFPGFETETPPQVTNLKAMSTSFVARKQELVQLEQWVEQGASFITICGIGGTGKTRLATEFGAHQAVKTGMHVWFVECAGANSADELVKSVAEVLGIQLTSDAPVQQVGNALRVRGPILVIVDNVEQIRSDTGKTLQQWAQTAPQSQFIVTSRQRLGIPEEKRLSLDPFTVEEGVALFYARAKEANVALRDTNDEIEVVREIVTCLDGISLAIELAAARCTLLSPKQLLTRLSKRFQLLQTTAKDKSHRQATLRNTIDWSWRLLEPHEQATLSQLSVCAARFTLEAAEAIVDLGEESGGMLLMDTLQSLQEQSLIRRVAHEDGTIAFGMYQTILAYALEQLGEDTKDVLHRHMTYFAGVCDAGVQAFVVDQEMANISRAFETALSMQDASAGAALGTAMIDRLNHTGPVQVAAEIIEKTVGISGIPPLKRAHLIARGVLTLRKLKKLTLEETELPWALAVAQESGDVLLEAKCHQLMMQLREDKGERKELIEECHALIQRFEHSEHPECAFEFYYTLAHHLLLQGKIQEVASCLQNAARLQHHAQNTHRRGALAHQWGRYYEHGGRLDKARVHYQRALDMHLHAKETEQQAMMMGCVANIHRTQGRYDEAKVYYDGALRLYREWGNDFRAALVLGNKGNFLKEIEEFDAAFTAYQESSAVFEALGRVMHQAVSYGNQGSLLIRMEQFEEAEEILLRCVTLCRQIQFKAEGPFLSYLACAYRHQGKLKEAAASLDESERLLEQTGQVVYVGVLNCERGLLALERKKLGAAKKYLVDAQAIATQLQANPKSDLGVAIEQLKTAVETTRPWYKAWFQGS